MSIKPIKSKMLKVLDRERKKTQEELDKYYHKMKETESYWGFNGPYARQEKANEKREQHLEEIERFEHQLESTVDTVAVRVYFFGCRGCGAVSFTTSSPVNDWHECPCCRKMIFTNNAKSAEIQVVDDGSMWTDMLKKAKEDRKEGD